MLDGVEANALQFELFGDINTPVLDILRDFRMIEVQVGEHQIVVVAVLCVDLSRHQRKSLG